MRSAADYLTIVALVFGLAGMALMALRRAHGRKPDFEDYP